MENNKNNDTQDELLKVLIEYTEKLRNISDEFISRKMNLLVYLICLVCAISTLVVLGPLALQESLNSFNRSQYHMYLILFLTMLIVGLVILRFFLTQKAKYSNIRKHTVIILKQMETIIRFASQFEDHSEARLGRRIELGLRLSEAEGIIDIVRNTLYGMDKNILYNKDKDENDMWLK